MPLVIVPGDENSQIGGESMIARLKNGVTRETLNAQLKTVAPRFWPELPPVMNGAQIQANSIAPILGNLARPLFILAGAVAFVLLIACVNISALLLGRGWSRQREIAMRKALGASRARIVRQLLVEGCLIAFLGASFAVVFTDVGVRALRAMAPPSQPRIAQAQLDTHVLIYTLAVSLVACLLFALLPALQASASSIGQAMKGGPMSAFSSFSQRPNRLRNALVIFEIASALVLVTAAALMSRSLDHLVRANLGFRTDHILTASASLNPTL
jgi:putative ABC transport system permease protein